MPEGDTIAWHALRIRPALEGNAPEEVRPHERFSRDRWPERLTGTRIQGVDTHGKHLFVRFDGDLVLHSHLGMVGSWGSYAPGAGPRPARHPGSPNRAWPASSSGWPRAPRRAWLVMRVGGRDVVQFDGSTLELITDGRRRFDQRLAALGPDVLAEEFDTSEFLRRLRLDDPTRPIGDALLDQRIVAGIGNMWKAEGCWEAELDPWRPSGEVSDQQVARVIDAVRPRMARSASLGPRAESRNVYSGAGRPCPRCGTTIRARGQWEDNRLTPWCPGCQQ